MNEVELSTWARDLGLRVPIVCAPMGGVAGGRLATAVSRAGALGMVGMGSTGSVEALQRELGELDPAILGSKGTTGGEPAGGREAPFGIGMVEWVMNANPGMLEIALDAQPDLLSVSFGEWEATAGGAAGTTSAPEWLEAARERGIRTITQVATVDQAKAAQDAGIGAVVARGLEAGGHGSPLTERAPLLEGVLAAVDIPVLAAGALATRADVLAVLDAGAAAAWVGTAFAACPEALTKEAARTELLAASGTDATFVTREQDIAKGYAWPEAFPERVLRADPTVNAGQGVSKLSATRSAAEVVAGLWG